MRLVLFVALLLSACDIGTVLPEFGDGYAVATDTAVLDGDTLRVEVSYSGGCEEHTFDLETRAAGPVRELWLVHDANGDLCEAYLTEALAVNVGRLPADGPVVLLTPSDGTVRLRN